MSEYVVALVTVPSKEVGIELSEKIISNKLAACVNIVSSINSIYKWDKAVQNDEECLLISKTTMDVFKEKFVDFVSENHPYDVPEIIALPIIYGFDKYLNWIKEETN